MPESFNKVDKQDSISFSDKIELQNNFLNQDRIDGYLSHKPWYKVAHLRYLNFYIFLVTLSSTNNGYDGSMLNGLQSLSRWQDKMSNPTGAVLGALSNGTVFGSILSFLVASWLADKVGRKWCIVFGQLITVAGAILQGASTNYAFFLVSRVVIGFGANTAAVASPSLISEIAYPTHREVTTTFYNVCWYLGAVIAAWVTYGTRTIDSDYSWRLPSYLQGLLPLVQILLFWMVPESPRYLINKGEVDKAEAVLRKYHIGNSNDERDVALVQFELKEIQAAIELEKINSKTRYSDFVTIPSFRKRIFLILFTATFMQLSGNALVSYYLSKVLTSIGITETTRQLEINGCLMIYNLVCASVVAGVVNRFKRRTLFVTSIGLMLLFFVIWTVLSAINQQRNFEQKSLGNGILAMIFFYYLAYNIGANGLPFLYVTEILPYSHRAKGINIFQLHMMIILVYNGFVNPVAMDALEWKYYIVFCCILAVELLVVYLFYVETSGYTLEEVAKVFGDDAETTLNVLSTPKEKISLDHVEHV